MAWKRSGVRIPSGPLSASYANSGERREVRTPRRELRPSDLPVLHVDGFEKGLVEATAHGWANLEVRGVTVPREPYVKAEDVLPAREIRLDHVEL
jgi:hypothetical protein